MNSLIYLYRKLRNLDELEATRQQLYACRLQLAEVAQERNSLDFALTIATDELARHRAEQRARTGWLFAKGGLN